MFVLISTQLGNAQQNIVVDETIYLHANASTFVSGETLLYKIYCLKSSDKTISPISKIAYVELVDSDKKSVFKAKIKLENALGQGDYFIPTTLKTGSYKLVAYTNWMLNKPASEFFQMDINIVNPYKTNEKAPNSNVLTSNSNTLESSVNTTDLNLRLNKKVFSSREHVDLKLESSNDNIKEGSYSLSVRKLDNIPTQNSISATNFAAIASNTIVLDGNSKAVLPELRGEMISGKVVSKSGTDKIQDVTVSFSLPGKSFVFQVVKTNSEGRFIFSIDKENYNPNIIIQVIDERADNYSITLDELPSINTTQLAFSPNNNLSYTFKESLLDRAVSSQIENAYIHRKKDNLEKQTTQDPFYATKAKEYVLDDYTRFKTLKETITEVTTEVYHKENNGVMHLHVTDPSVFPQLPDPALVLVDGLQLQNQIDLLKYNMKNIYRIDLIVGRYYVGPKSFNGLVSFITFDKDFASTQSGSSILKTTILRPQLKKIYNNVDYTNLADNARIPDFRNQLLWNPDVKLNKDSQTSFYTSDVAGNYEIRLEGFAKNGTPVSIKELIEVKDTATN